MIVSGNPPLLLIITAHPFAEASRLVLPNGSSHLEQTTAILVLVNMFNTLSCGRKPSILRFLCLNIMLSLSSSPITMPLQFLYLLDGRGVRRSLLRNELYHHQSRADQVCRLLQIAGLFYKQ